MISNNNDIFTKINNLNKKNIEISKIIEESINEREKNIQLIFEESKKLSDKCVHNLDLIYDECEHYYNYSNHTNESGDCHSIRCLRNHTTENMSNYYFINILDDDGNYNLIDREDEDGEIICYDSIYYKRNIIILDKEICQQYIEHNENLGRRIYNDINFYRCKYCLQLLFSNKY